MRLFISACAVLIMLCCGISHVKGQATKGFSQDLVPIQGSIKLREFAALYYDIGDYQSALPLYEQLSHRYPDRIKFLYRTGVCYLYTPGGNQLAIGYLEKVLHLDPEKEGLAFHLGKAFHANGDFDLGIKYFDYLLSNKSIAKADGEFIARLRESCVVGKELTANPLDIRISNIGLPINSTGTEYVPLLSQDESTLIFTHKRSASNDLKDLVEGTSQYDNIYISYKEKDLWSKPKSISSQINSPQDDEAAVGISADGKSLLILKYSDESSGDLYISNKKDGDWTKPVRLKGEVNSVGWEGSASFTKNGKMLYFDSEREGGLGGTDIYTAELQNDGSWGNVTNLGSTINTIYNDEAAFIHVDNKTLYFSSDGHRTMGGYDIFKSTLDSKGNWSTPQNVGSPINSPANDKFFVVSKDGKRAYYHQNRPGGYGDLDLYMVNFDLPALKEEPVVVVATEATNTKEVAASAKSDETIKERDDTQSEAAYSEPVKAAKAPISISGNVHSSGSSPIFYSNTTIKLVGDGGKRIAETNSDSRGQFVFKNLSGNDNYAIEVIIDAPKASKASKVTASRTTTGREATQPKRNSTSAAVSSSSELSNVTVASHAVCKSVQDRSPQGETSEFSSEDDKIWFYTLVTSPSNATETITHKWYYNGKQISTVDLQTRGPRWRTFSYKTVESWMKGPWKVEAISSKGVILADKEFKVN